MNCVTLYGQRVIGEGGCTPWVCLGNHEHSPNRERRKAQYFHAQPVNVKANPVRPHFEHDQQQLQRVPLPPTGRPPRARPPNRSRLPRRAHPGNQQRFAGAVDPDYETKQRTERGSRAFELPDLPVAEINFREERVDPANPGGGRVHGPGRVLGGHPAVQASNGPLQVERVLLPGSGWKKRKNRFGTIGGACGHSDSKSQKRIPVFEQNAAKEKSGEHGK